MKMQMAEIAKALNTTCEGDDKTVITSVAFDSRNITTGGLFVPLEGERDGHDFVAGAISNGASATLWKKGHPNKPENITVIEVDNPLTAMQDLARYYLRKVNPTVVGITGSNGKTTTKDMIAAVLSKRFNVHKTQANFNNEIGVPMTILEMKPNTEILVLEMGMDRPGQLHHLSELTHPDVAVITMIGEAHIEFFGSRDKIADAKMEITDFLREDGEFIYNGDEPLLQERAKKLDQAKATFGFRDEDTVHATGFKSYMHHATFTINDSEQKFSIPMIGKHNVSNAMAAISVGHHFGESDEEIASSLSNFKPTANRMEWEKGDAGEAIMSDVYNSNPTAVRAVVTSFGQVEVKDGGRRIAVLGDMLELGEKSPELHAGLSDTLDPQIINEVYLYGSEMKNLYDALQDKYEPENLHYYTQDQMDHMINDLKNDIKPDDIIVLKGSHGMHLENVLARLRQENNFLKFSELGLNDALLKAIKRSGFEEATPIQEQTIPLALQGKDVIGQAQTGTGKTAAFGLPILQSIDKNEKAIQAIIIEPTRELAIQTQEELFRLGRDEHAHVQVVYGGADIGRQIRSLKHNVPSILVGTPGRLLDHLKRGTIDLDKVNTVVLDEADEMLDMGFIQDIESILKYAKNCKQTLLFSATMPKPILRIGEKFMKDPAIVQIKAKELTADLIDQYFVRAKESEKFDIMCRLIDVQGPDLALVFGRTKRRVDELTRGLQARGYNAAGIHGDLSQARRMAVLKRFREGKLDILVATDVAARGLDISGVTHVYNYDIPQDPDSYVHRIGRTGRAGQNGVSVTFVTPNEISYMRTIEQLTKKKMSPLRLPTDDQALRGQLKQAKAEIEDLMNGDLGKYTQDASELLDNYSALDLVAAFLKNLAKDSTDIKVKITPEKPLPYRGDGRHGRGRRGHDNHGRGRGHGNYHRRRNSNDDYRHNGNRGRRGRGNGHKFAIKNKKD